MARQAFRSCNFRPDSLQRILLCNRIINVYQAQNLRLTLRQLYYQLVSRNEIPNSEKSYKGLGKLVSDARLAGLMDWDAIEDRVRQPKAASEWNGLGDLVEAALYSYRLPRWKGQDKYVELWVEKDALAGVLWPIATRYHVTLMVNRGYSSQSAMYESARRFQRNEEGEEGMRDLHILYLGDHDPSGEDMVTEVQERLLMFGVQVNVDKVALTWEQISEYNPPPNPAKVSDPRAKGYIEKFGDESWEVDALPPDVLTKLITSKIESLVDTREMDRVKAMEEADKKTLRELVKSIER